MRTVDLFRVKRYDEALKYLIVFLTVVLSRDTLLTSVRFGFVSTFIFNIGLVLVVFFLSVLKIGINEFIYQSRFRIKFAVIPILIVFVSLLKFDFQLYHLSIIFYILTAFIFSYIFTFESFFKKLSNVMIFLGLYSFFTVYFLRPLIFANNSVAPGFNVVFNSANLPFIDFVFSYVVALPFYLRNFGIFREPGVFQFYLLIPFIFELFLRKVRIQYLKLFVLILSTISTFSIPGIAVLSFLLFIKFLQVFHENELQKKDILNITIGLILILSAFAFAYFQSSFLRDQIYEMYLKLTTLNPSSIARIESIVETFSYFLRNPILGHNFSTIVFLVKDNTTTSLSLFAIYGVTVGIVSLLFHFEFTKKISSRIYLRCLSFFGIFLLINTQFLLGNSLYWIFLLSPLYLSKISTPNSI